MKYNYHTHTVRCGHASGKDREYVEEAIRAGVEEMGFSDHVPFRFPDGFEAGYRVPTALAEDYVSSVRALKEEFADKIKIRIGFEMEYYPAYFAEMLSYVRNLGAEYLILAQHFPIDEKNSRPSAEENSSEEDFVRYVDRAIEGMGTGVFTYLAHPDIFRFVGSSEVYDREMRRLCLAAKKTEIPLEINFLGIRDHRFYPHEEFWQIAGEIGAPVVVGYDAHSPQDAGDRESYVRAMELVEKYGLRFLDKPTVRSIR